MRPVRLAPAAEAVLVRLELFLAEKSERAALAAADALLAAVRSLDTFPERGRPGVGAGRRELVIRFGRGGYVLRYRVTEDAVVVTRIFHTRERR